MQLVEENCTRRDAAPARLQAWKDTLPPYRKANMTGKWGPNMHLQYVGTQPEYQRHGAGTALLKWGIDTAKEHNLWIGIFGSPVGAMFYKHLGFEVVGDVRVQAEGEEEYVMVTAMGLSPSKADSAADNFDRHYYSVRSNWNYIFITPSCSGAILTPPKDQSPVATLRR